MYNFLTQLCLLSPETLKQTTYLLKCTTKMFASSKDLILPLLLVLSPD